MAFLYCQLLRKKWHELKVLVCLRKTKVELYREWYLFGFWNFYVYGILIVFSDLYKFFHLIGKSIETKYLLIAKHVKSNGAIKSY